LRHVRDLASVLARRAHVDQRFAAFTLRQCFIKKGANFLVESFLWHRIVCLCILRNVARHGATFGFPFVPATVENFHFVMSKHSEGPNSVAGPPVGIITIKNAGGIWCDAVTTAELRELLG